MSICIVLYQQKAPSRYSSVLQQNCPIGGVRYARLIDITTFVHAKVYLNVSAIGWCKEVVV